MAKKLYIKTYGCQMNVYDSARMTDVLAPLGYVETDDVGAADMVVLNTCHIREKAAEKVYSELGRINQLKREKIRGGGEMMIAVAGCVAQAEGKEVFARAPFVDLVVGPQAYHRLPELVARAERAAGKGLATDFPVEPKFDFLPPAYARVGATSAFLTVQEGCDKFCTFCVVPYTRGAEQSRPAVEILSEAKRYAEGGVREITLLGQNVNNYHGAAPDGDEWRLEHLIAAIADVPGIERIRYTTSYPADMTDGLIAAHRDIPQLMPYLHLPVQSGSDAILAAMNRRHTSGEYLRLVDRLRRARPDLALSSDFIVGFPGETDADFDATLDVVQKVGFSQAYSFRYSPRPGTPAAMMPQVDEATKAERLARLQAVLDAQQRRFNAACVGRVMDVLFERRGRFEGQLVGRSPYMQAVHSPLGDDHLGQILPVEITAGFANSLAGDPLGSMLV